MLRFLACFCFFSSLVGLASGNPWRAEAMEEPPADLRNPNLRYTKEFATFRLDSARLREDLARAPREVPMMPDVYGTPLTLPKPDGTFERFLIWRTQLLSSELEKKGPQHLFFTGQGIDDPTAILKCDLGPNGFQAYVLRNGTTHYVTNLSRTQDDRFVAFEGSNSLRPGLDCSVEGENQLPAFLDDPETYPTPGRLNGALLYTLKMAINGTVEYTNLFTSVNNAQADMATKVNNLNAIFERDVSVRFTLFYRRAWSGVDFFTGDNKGALLAENQLMLDTNLINPTAPGIANYDVGHVFSGVNFGGLASVASAGTSNKARGTSGDDSPGSTWLDFVFAHEVGHQMGSRHTFNSDIGSCSSQRDPQGAYEPGSGSSLMSYFGQCTPVSNTGHLNFHISNIIQMRNHILAVGVFPFAVTGNTIPTVDAGTTLVVPRGAGFRFTPASWSDNTPSSLTFSWEQYDLATSAGSYSIGNPLLRCFAPITNPTRHYPRPEWLESTGDFRRYNFAPNIDDTIAMRMVVRDNRAGGGAVAFDTRTLQTFGSPMAIEAPPEGSLRHAGNIITIEWQEGTWNVPNVRIKYSPNDATEYAAGLPAAVIVTSTPNDGITTVLIPGISTNNARFIMEPIGNDNWFVIGPRFRVDAQNRSPWWNTIPTQDINEEATWNFNLEPFSNDPDVIQTRTFSLVSGPPGMTVSSAGIMNWTPTEAQGFSSNSVTVRVRDNGTPSLTMDHTFTVRVQEVFKTLSGVIAFDGSPVYPFLGTTARIRFVNTAGQVSFSPVVTLNALRQWTVPTNLSTFPAGRYNVFVKPRGWLSAQVSGLVDVSPTGASGITGTVRFNGDANDDDQIGPDDFSAVLAAFGTETGGPGYNLFVDFDRNGEIGPLDFTVVLQNFGLEGEMP